MKHADTNITVDVWMQTLCKHLPTVCSALLCSESTAVIQDIIRLTNMECNYMYEYLFTNHFIQLSSCTSHAQSCTHWLNVLSMRSVLLILTMHSSSWNKPSFLDRLSSSTPRMYRPRDLTGDAEREKGHRSYCSFWAIVDKQQNR